ncbi:Sec-independent protein translocase protein TatC [Oxobacter pfennigii]|uniref:Sec-independent protein translocase protein TatC n=1 Tax=Oxobacter pfennigii TaxID=36849 RepID=A0A0P9ALB6_9CLOT|nr:twin-arginine translocase subunit TatC [Oxobacter pfennigii]KPU46158.1 Sec-independent protein translocase protein TatC [Oxobacter pfennigii]
MNDKKLTLVGHLAELRKRFVVIAIAIIALSSLSYYYIEFFVNELLKIGSQLEFIYLSPPELFMAYIKLSIVIGITLSMPVILMQVWLFVKPGLTGREKRYVLLSILGGFVFFALGVTFAYKAVLPVTIKFFMNITIDSIKPMISFENYIGFIGSILLAFGAVFEMPILSVALTKFGIINDAMLKKNRKIVILAIFIVAAIITPPDVISQLLLSGPMLLLFEASIVLSRIVGKERRALKNNIEDTKLKSLV